MNQSSGVMYPYRSPRTVINTVQANRKSQKQSYHVEGIVNGIKTNFLIDTGAEVSLISATVPGLETKESQISPVSITHQPIRIQGETEVFLKLGNLETSWKFLVVDNLKESVLGADFIENHHKDSWGIANNKFWLDNVGIPLTELHTVRVLKEDSHSPVIAKCTVELPARHQVVIPMRTKDKSCKTGLFEPTKSPGGILMSKTAVQGSKDGSFWIRVVNLTYNNVTIYKNQKTGILSDINEVSEPLNAQSNTAPAVSGVQSRRETELSLEELGIDLNQSQLSTSQHHQLEKLLLLYSDIFSKDKRDLGKCQALCEASYSLET